MTTATATQAPASESRLSLVLRMVVHAITAAVIAWPLTRGEAVVAGALGAATGALVGPMVARTRVRTPALAGIGVVTLLLAIFLRWVAVGTGLVAPALGPATALRLGDALLFGVGALAVSGLLRGLSARRPSLAVLEVGLVAVAFAQLVVAHRHGAINRPFAIADPIIAAGGDPTTAFLVIGAIAAGVVAMMLLSERSVGRALLHVGVAAALVLLVTGTTHMFGPPAPPSGAGGGLGLRPDEGESEQERQQRERREGQGEGEGRGRRNNEQLEFRDNYDQSNQRTPVGVVVFHDDYSPPSGTYYFRQGAFSQYNGRRLVASTDDDVDRDIASRFPAAAMKIPEQPPVAGSRTTLEHTVALLADHTRPFALESPVRLEPANNPDPGRFKRMYKAVSAPLTADYASMIEREVGKDDWDAEQRAHYLEKPDDPRYEELADRIVDERLPEHYQDDPVARALALTQWLGEKGTYSLKSKHAEADDPTAHFLFGDKTGYCVHFAHAATYMMRTVGVPARVATGYAVDEAARQGGSALLVSGSASHAWPEVYVDGLGWVPFDVAPQRVLTPPPPPPDPDLQRLLGELVRGEKPLPADAAPQLPELARTLRDLGTFVAYALGLLAVALALLMFTGKAWRRLVPAFAGPAALPRVVYRAELDRLSEMALRRRPGESREAFAARVREVAPSFARLTAIHVGAAFGSRRARAEAESLRELARDVRGQLRARYPWWRRALGWLIPWSWLQAR